MKIPKGAILLEEAALKLGVVPDEISSALVTELKMKPETASKYVQRGYIPSGYRPRLDELSRQKGRGSIESRLIAFESGFRLEGVNFEELAKSGQLENVKIIIAMYERLADKALDSARGRDLDDPPSAKRVVGGGR